MPDTQRRVKAIAERLGAMFYNASVGYVPYEVLEGHYRSLGNALAQVDMAFVKHDSVLRKDGVFFSAEQVQQYLESGKL